MSLLDQGCTCDSCLKITLQNLLTAREKWKNGERELIITPYHYECSDGCCDEYGSTIYVNGFDLNCDIEDFGSVIEGLMEFLRVENVSVNYEYENENE